MLRYLFLCSFIKAFEDRKPDPERDSGLVQVLHLAIDTLLFELCGQFSVHLPGVVLTRVLCFRLS